MGIKQTGDGGECVCEALSADALMALSPLKLRHCRQ